MNSQSDRVSVIIPLYQGEAYISQAIRSVLDQTVRVHEVLVVDDGSRDGGAAIARRFGPPVQVMSQENGGPGAARNTGCRNATGELLAFLDQDDLWHPEKLERQLPHLADPGVSMVHSAVYASRDTPVPRGTTFEEMWVCNRVAQSSVVLRRSVFQRLGPMATDLVGVEDYNYWLRMLAEGYRVLQCPGIWVRWWVMPTSYSANPLAMYEAECRNVQRFAWEYRVPASEVRRKYARLALHYGRDLLHHRELSAARRLLGRSLTLEPGITPAWSYVASCVPERCLNVLRRFRYGTERPAEPTPPEGWQRLWA